ncbi:MAG: TrmB family transcriptional regulator [Parcubacteria group bacterium]|nr:TrmB family transcriptional regulator [Parcubacteria group bacterium]
MKTFWKKTDLEPLLAVGLTENQAKIYLVALHHGLVTAVDIARLTGINRQQVYSDTEKLIENGLLDITRKQRKKFIAADPKALVTLAEKRVGDARLVSVNVVSALPFLDSLRGGDFGNKVKVKHFEGMKRLEDAYSQELEACRGTEVLSFVGSVDDLFQFFPEKYWKKWNEKFVKQKNSSKMLVHYSDEAKETAANDSSYNRETRFISPFPLKVNVDVFGNTVLILSANDELAIWIDSAIIADSYRILFKTCWNYAKPF